MPKHFVIQPALAGFLSYQGLKPPTEAGLSRLIVSSCRVRAPAKAGA